ncbi:hypothetical protein GCM10022258_21400 [Aquimarina gracilis]
MALFVEVDTSNGTRILVISFMIQVLVFGRLWLCPFVGFLSTKVALLKESGNDIRQVLISIC